MTLESMREDVVGVDLGARHIRLAQVVRQGEQGITIRRAACEKYDPLAGSEVIAAQLRHMWRRAGFSTYTAVSCLRSRSVYFKHCRLPAMSDAEAQSAILVEAEESLHLPPANIAADWHRIRVDGDSAQDMQGVLVAVSRVEVDRHLAILEAARLYTVAVDVSCLSVCNLVTALKNAELNGKVICVVSVSEDNADVAIMYRDGAIYPRTIYFRSQEAEAIAKYLVENVMDVLKYYQFKLNPTPVDKLILTGNASHGDPVHARLLETVDLPVELWDPLRDPRVAGAGRIPQNGQAEEGWQGMAAVLGLALRGSDHG